ncbi:MAG TPA: YbhB/YbcL family Raf kinase inhibitor-like protein [Solirubrobacteraceae bacterium]|nr:YbhB/YbcL family Raf kinase inhibitor-like protein [Solirubrobacteraceae bacterium]
MGRRLNATVGGALALALVLAGCGGSSSSSKSQSSSAPAGSASQSSSSAQTGTSATAPAPTGAQKPKSSVPKEHLPTVSIEMSSPTIKNRQALPARYTCDGADVSPPLRWSAIPKGTAELALVVTSFSLEGHGEEKIQWAVAGLQPTLKGLAAGRLPAGAVVGRNGLGQSRYSICPSKGHVQHYAVILYALPHPVSATPGFDAKAFSKAAEKTAEYKGLYGLVYKRA